MKSAMENPALQYFEETKKYSDIKNFITSRAREGTYLDFKTASTSNDEDKKVKETLSRAASGYAHQGGGIIVWGIVAKQSSNGDYAQSESHIKELSKFVEKLKNFSLDCVEPRLNIQHKIIHINDDPKNDEGFIVTFFPKSNAVHCGRYSRYNFYQRHGDNFFPIVTKDELALLLNRNTNPLLELVVSPLAGSYKKNDDGSETITQINCRLLLKNVGNGIAEYPSIEIDATHQIGNLYNTGNEVGLLNLKEDSTSSARFMPKAGFVVHPGQEVHIGTLTFNGSKPPIIKYKAYAKNMPSIEETLNPEL